jgi:hypothetical protein
MVSHELTQVTFTYLTLHSIIHCPSHTKSFGHSPLFVFPAIKTPTPKLVPTQLAILYRKRISLQALGEELENSSPKEAGVSGRNGYRA